MFGKTWIRFATAALAALPLLAAAAGPAFGIVTIADGELTLLRDTERFAGAEGLRVRADDIVVTGEKTRLVRIELADGKVLDLGPATQVMLQPRALARDPERPATAYLAAGWLKLAAPANQTAPAVLAGPRLDAVGVGGTVIAHAAPDLAWLFVESGVAEAVLHADGHRAAPQAMRDADSLLQRGAAAPESGRLPPAEMLAQMPRPFTDTLPRRAARLADQAFDAAKGSPASYADVAPWLNGEPALRGAFVHRFTPRSREGAFRASLVAELRLHPEWRPVLFPPPPPPPKPRPAPVLPPAPETATEPQTVVKAPE
ncbi:MAG: hypothetical protein U1F50_01015 [Rubrivivax sp.]